MTTYTTTGSVRGSCGHAHETVYGALQCLRADIADCRAAGGYSDRGLERSDGDDMTASDMAAWDAALVELDSESGRGVVRIAVPYECPQCGSDCAGECTADNHAKELS